MQALRFHYSLGRLAATTLLSRVWRGAYTSAVSPLKLVNLPEPVLPGPDWVRVRTRLAGICGSDLKQAEVKGDLDNPLTALISFPHVLGHEAVGEIESVGPAVRGLQPGQRIVLNPWLTCRTRGIEPVCPACQQGDLPLCRNMTRGSLPAGIHLGNNRAVAGVFAPLFACHASQCFLVPAGVSDEGAVLADPFSVSLHSILRHPPPAGAPALVYGLGVLGLLAIAILHRLYPGIEVYTIGRHPHQLELARQLGASQVLHGRPAELIEQVSRLTGASLLKPWNGLPWSMDGVGIIYDTIGSPETVAVGLRIVQAQGKIVISGVEAPRRFEWTPLYFKEVSLVGSNAFGLEPYQGQKRHAMEIYLELAQQGLDLSWLVTHQFSLAEYAKAFHALLQRQTSQAVKVVFDFR